LAQEVVADLAGFLEQSRGMTVPWAGARVFETKIRRNIKLAESPSFGKSIFAYAPKSSGAADYTALAEELLGESTVVGPMKLAVSSRIADEKGVILLFDPDK
jgi:chromosome partitioning protein